MHERRLFVTILKVLAGLLLLCLLAVVLMFLLTPGVSNFKN
jgi:hypothetical protein